MNAEQLTQAMFDAIYVELFGFNTRRANALLGLDPDADEIERIDRLGILAVEAINLAMEYIHKIVDETRARGARLEPEQLVESARYVASFVSRIYLTRVYSKERLLTARQDDTRLN